VFSPSAAFALVTQSTLLPLVYASGTTPILDETGSPILDETGSPILIEAGGITIFSPSAAVITGTLSPVLPLVEVAEPTVYDPLAWHIAVLPLVTVTAPTLFNTTVTQEDPHLLPLVTVPDPTVFAFVVTTTGTLVVEMELAFNPPTVFIPQAVQASPQDTVLPLVANIEAVFSPRASHVTVEAPTPYIFQPPHDSMGPRKLSEQGRRRAGVSRLANNLSSRYAAPQSYSVLKIDGVYQTIQGPTYDDIDASTEYYAGGHEHPVTEAQAAALEAAGYEVLGYP
jgi:hypothetical protein